MTIFLRLLLLDSDGKAVQHLPQAGVFDLLGDNLARGAPEAHHLDLLDTIDRVKKRANPRLQILGALLTLFDRRTILSRDIREQVREAFGEKLFETEITKSVRLEESPAYREPIFSFAPRSTGAFQYYKLSEEVLSRV